MTILLGLDLGGTNVRCAVGHQTVEPDVPRCGCGNRGCLDRMAGAAAIASYAGTATVTEAVGAALWAAEAP